MPVHTVKQGDCLASIAKQYGFKTWRTIYDDAQNSDFKKKRPNPNIISVGDQIFIPDKSPKAVSRPTGQQHTFVLTSDSHRIRLVIKNSKGEPYAGKKFKLTVGADTYEGTTGGDGLVEQKIVGHEEDAGLQVWLKEDGSGKPLTWKLKIGHLDPVEEPTGVQARLNNLGFKCGAVDGNVGPRTQAALKAFQTKMGLSATGEIDDDTRNKLRELHEGQ